MNNTEQITYWILQEKNNSYWTFCLHPKYPERVYTVYSPTLDFAESVTVAPLLGLPLGVGINTLEQAREMWNNIHFRGVKVFNTYSSDE